MRNYPIHQIPKHQIHYAWLEEVSKQIYDEQFTTVTTHKNAQNYYNEKCAKYLMFDLKKYREVIFHDTEGWCKNWRKTDLWFGKRH